MSDYDGSSAEELAVRIRDLQERNRALEIELQARDSERALLYPVDHVLSSEQLFLHLQENLNRLIAFDVLAMVLFSGHDYEQFLHLQRPVVPEALNSVQSQIRAALTDLDRAAWSSLLPAELAGGPPAEDSGPSVDALNTRLLIPLKPEGSNDVLGIMFLGAESAHAFSDRHARLVESVAGRVTASARRLRDSLQTEGRLDHLVDDLPLGIVQLAADYRILHVNAAGQRFLPLMSPGTPGEVLVSLNGSPLETILAEAQDGSLELTCAGDPPVCLEVMVAAVTTGPDAGGWLLTLQDITPRKMAETELAENERLFRLLAEESTDVVALHELDGRFAYVSPSGAQQFGYTVSELIGSNAFDMIHPDDLKKTAEAYERTLAGEEVARVRYRFLTKSGDPLWLETMSRVIDLPQGGRGVITSSRDVTATVSAERALRESERRYATLAEIAPVGISRSSPSHELLFANGQSYEMTGIERDVPMTSELWMQAIHEDDRAEVRRAWGQSLETRTEFELEFRFHHVTTGKVVWVYGQAVPEFDGEGDFLGYIGTITDITPIKEAEQALRESERRYATLAEVAPVGIFRSNVAGATVFVNDLVCQITGLCQDDGVIASDAWMQAIYEEDRARVEEVWREVRQKRGKFEAEHRFVNAESGAVTWVYGQAVPEFDDEGNLLGYMGTITDITRLKEAERAMLASERRYAILTESVPVGIFRTDRDESRLWVNDQVFEITGSGPEVLFGGAWRKSVHEEDSAEVHDSWDETQQAEGKFEAEFRVYNKPRGEAVWVYVQTVPEFDEEGNLLGHIGTITDITRLKDTEQALRESERRYATLADVSPVGIFRLDHERNPVYVNDRAVAIIGPDRESLMVADAWVRSVHEVDRARVVDNWVKVWQSQSPLEVEYRSVHPTTGEIIWLYTQGVPEYDDEGGFLGYIGTITDITPLKHAEQALRESEQRYATLTETVPVGIFRTDHEGNAVYMNEWAIQIIGLDRDSLNTALWIEAIHDDDRVQTLAIWAEATESHSRAELEFRLLNASTGELVWVYSHAMPEFDAAGNFRGYLGTVTDITRLKETEQALRVRERQLRTIFDSQIDLVCRFTTDFKLTFVNRAYCDYFDRTRKSLIGSSILSLLPSSLHEQAIADYARLTETKRSMVREFYFDSPEGRRWQQWVIQTIIDDDGEIGFQAVGRDITERKAAEGKLRALTRDLEYRVQERTEELLAAKTRVEAILDSSFDAIIFVGSDSVIQQANWASYEWFGYAPGALDGKPFQSLIVPEHHQALEAAFREVLEQGIERQIEVVAVDLDGVRFFVDLGLAPVHSGGQMMSGIVCNLRDTTERRRAEDRLKRAENLARSTLDGLKSNIAIVDEQGVIRLVNQAWRDFYEANSPSGTVFEHVGANYLAVCEQATGSDAGDIAGEFASGIRSVLAGERDLFEIVYTMEIPDGKHFHDGWFEGVVIPLSMTQDDSPHVVVSHTDITVRKQAEINLQKLLKQEQELSNLRSHFVSMASHEFRTPLATILITSENLRVYFDRMSEEKRTMRFEKIRDAVNHMTGLLEEVLLVGRLDSGAIPFKPELTDLSQLCQEVVDEILRNGSPGFPITFQCEGVEDCRAVWADRRLLRQIITNLVSNAIKYSPEGTPVQITLGCDDREATLTVRDSGIGIPEADQSQLFETFHRAANVGGIKGSGLGLSIVKRAVDLHEGTIIFESEESVGTTFTVRIPRVPPADVNDGDILLD